LDEARRTEGLIVSAISVWEFGMHAVRGRIQLAVPLRDRVERALGAPGIRLAPLDAAVAAESTLLPGESHRAIRRIDSWWRLRESTALGLRPVTSASSSTRRQDTCASCGCRSVPQESSARPS